MSAKPIRVRHAALRRTQLSVGLAVGCFVANHAALAEPRHPQGVTWPDEFEAAHSLRSGNARSNRLFPIATTPLVRARPAATFTVSNCNDGGSGSLREAAGLAGASDVIDLTSLSCSTISTSFGGAIQINDTTVNGPGAAALTIDGAGASQVFHHDATGVLALSGFTIANGKYRTSLLARGGCIYSHGTVFLLQMVLTNCSAIGTGTDPAQGGALFAYDGAVLVQATVTGSRAVNPGAAGAAGGGVFAGQMSASYSTFSDNTADGGGHGGIGGAAYVLYDTALDASTVSGNKAEQIAGVGANLTGIGGGTSVINSTISGNDASDSRLGSGLFAGGSSTIESSTITNNTEANVDDRVYGAGFTIGDLGNAYLASSLIAGNTIVTSAGAFPDDVSGEDGAAITGSHDLIGLSILPTPPDTIIADPKLGPLADNGGPTLTHALLSTSPAIDAGFNPAALAFDQRGNGFARTFGPATDIGAIEYHVVDDIFRNGFEPPI